MKKENIEIGARIEILNSEFKGKTGTIISSYSKKLDKLNIKIDETEQILYLGINDIIEELKINRAIINLASIL